MNIVIDSEGLVLMWSDRGKPTPPEGGQMIVLSEAQEAAFRVATATPNDGLTFDGEDFSTVPPAALVESANDKRRALIRRRSEELEKGDLAQQVEALRLRLSLVEGG